MILLAIVLERGSRPILSSDHSAIDLRQAIANMLSLGARVIGQGLAIDIVDAFLTAQFEGGRHTTRVDMIEALED